MPSAVSSLAILGGSYVETLDSVHTRRIYSRPVLIDNIITCDYSLLVSTNLVIKLLIRVQSNCSHLEHYTP